MTRAAECSLWVESGLSTTNAATAQLNVRYRPKADIGLRTRQGETENWVVVNLRRSAAR